MKQTCHTTHGNSRNTGEQRVEFIRLPKNGLCPYTGLSRSKLNQLILPCEQNDWKPPVKSVCLRKRGAIKGTRLILLESLLDHIYRQMEEEEFIQLELPLKYDSEDTTESRPKE